MAKGNWKSSPRAGGPASSKPPAASASLPCCPYSHLSPRRLAERLGRVKRDGSGPSIRFLECWRRNARKRNGLESGPPFHTTVNATLYCISPEFDEWFNRYSTRTREGLPPGLARWQAEQRAKNEATEKRRPTASSPLNAGTRL